MTKEGVEEPLVLSAVGQEDPCGQSFAWPKYICPGAASSASRSSKQQPRDAPAEEASSLVHFLQAVGTDIRTVLHRSAPCKRPIDHRKYLQRQLRRRRHATDYKDMVTSPENIGGCDKSLQYDDIGGGPSCINPKEGPSAPEDLENHYMKLGDVPKEGMTVKVASVLPLRQRQLPASFWQEPNQPRSVEKPPTSSNPLLPVYRPLYGSTYDPRAVDPSAYCTLTYSGGYLSGVPNQTVVPPCIGTQDVVVSSAFYQPSFSWPYGFQTMGDELRAHFLNPESTYLCNSPVYRISPSGLTTPRPSWDNRTISNRAGVWRPIPTKTNLSKHRYHPIGDGLAGKK